MACMGVENGKKALLDSQALSAARSYHVKLSHRDSCALFTNNRRFLPVADDAPINDSQYPKVTISNELRDAQAPGYISSNSPI